MNEDDNVTNLADDADVFTFPSPDSPADSALHAAKALRRRNSAFKELGKALGHLVLQSALFMFSVGVVTVLVAIPVKFVLEHI